MLIILHTCTLLNYMQSTSCTLSQSHPYTEFNDKLRQSLECIVGNGNLSTSLAVREHHGKDESHHECAPPDVVVFPSSVEEVSKIAK